MRSAARLPSGRATTSAYVSPATAPRPLNTLLTSSFAQITERMSSLTIVSAAGWKHLGEPARSLARRAVQLADHERPLRRLREVAGAQVGRAPLDDAGDQVVRADELGEAVLDEPVAERDEGSPFRARTASWCAALSVISTKSNVSSPTSVHRLDLHGALLAELVEPQARVEPRDVVRVGIEHDDPPHGAGQLGGRHAADRPAAHHQHRRVDHSSSSLASAA